MIRYYFSRQFIGFALVGVFAAIIHWAARVVLNIWLPFTWAVAAAYGIGMLSAFCLYSRYIFPKSTTQKHKQIQSFMIINLLMFPVVWGASLSLDYTLNLFGMVRFRHELAHAIAVVLPSFATFLIYKFSTFKDANYGKS